MPEIPQEIQNKAGEIQARFNAGVTDVRSNGDLTADAKLRRLARLWTDAEAEMGTLRQTWQGTSTISAESLTKSIFGASASTGVDAISARDAADRAAQIDDADEAQRLLTWALDNGDQILARAVAQFAFDRRNEFFGGDWAGVVDTYAAAHPEVAQKIEDLINLRADNLNTSVAGMFVFSIFKPPELDNVRASAMATLLAG